MRVEVVAIGSELLLGQIVDTNSSWIGEQLAAVGLDSHYQTKVGDNPERMRDVLLQAMGRSDAVICCGGLGPTQDDLTRDVIADVLGVELEFRQELAERIEAMFERRGRRMPENNLRQAMVPEGCAAIDIQPGTAPGLCCPIPDDLGTEATVLYAVPGVPYEMKEMMTGFILGDLSARSGEPAVIRSRVLRCWGASESELAELLADRIAELDAVTNPTLAFLASGVEGLKVRITAKAATEEAALAVLDTEEARLWPLIGQLVFARDDDTMEVVILRRLADLGLTVAVAETATGGYLANRLTLAAQRLGDSPSSAFGGGVVVSDELRAKRLLGLDLEPAEEDPVASLERRAVDLAEGVRATFGVDVGLGLAGPGGRLGLQGEVEEKVGSARLEAVAFAVSSDEGSVASTQRVPADPDRGRQFPTIALLDLLRRILG